MGRPKGSLNKRDNGSLFLTKFEKQVCGSAITRPSSRGWINWGLRNDYPILLLDLYNQSPTHRACVNFAVQSIVGDGVDFDTMKLDGSATVPNYKDTWDDLIRDISLDYILYGSYAIEIIKNKDNKTFSFWHIPLDKVRWSEYDSDGQITSYWICNDWTRTAQCPPIQVDAFDMRDSSKIKQGKPYLYVKRQYSPSMVYYTQPQYQAAIKAIQSEIEYLNYDLKTTVNNFVPCGMLVLNQVETDDERRATIDNIQRMFQGSENANSLLISFKNNQNEEAPSFVPFTTQNGNVNLYESANQRNVQRILAGHQITTSTLVGIPDIGQSGFSSEADKMEVGYEIYNKIVGNNNRISVIKSLNQMLKMNGIDTEVIMKPLTFGNSSSTSMTPTKVDEKTIDNNNVEEKKEGVQE